MVGIYSMLLDTRSNILCEKSDLFLMLCLTFAFADMLSLTLVTPDCKKVKVFLYNSGPSQTEK